MTNTTPLDTAAPQLPAMGNYPYKWIKVFYSKGSGYDSEPHNASGESIVDETLVEVNGTELQQFIATLETKHRAEVEELNESKNHTIKNMMEEIRYLSSSQPERRKPVIRIKSGDTWYIPMITQAIDTPDGLFVEADLDLTTTTSESHHE